MLFHINYSPARFSTLKFCLLICQKFEVKLGWKNSRVALELIAKLLPIFKKCRITTAKFEVQQKAKCYFGNKINKFI